MNQPALSPILAAGFLMMSLLTAASGCSRPRSIPPESVFSHETEYTVEHAAFSESGKQLLVVAPSKLYVFKVEDGELLCEVPLENFDYSNNFFEWASFSPDNKQIFASYSGSSSIQIYDIATGKKAGSFGPFDQNPLRCEPAKILGKVLVRENYRRWQLYDLNHKKPDWHLQFGSQVMSRSHAYAHPVLAGMEGHEKVIFANVDKGEKLQQSFEVKECVRGIDISKDRKWVVTGDESGTATVYDLEKDKVIWTSYVDRDGAFAVSIRPDNDLVAVGCMSGIKILSIKQQKIIAGWNGHEWFVDSLEFSPDGKYLLSASPDKFTKIWKTSECLSGNSYETQ